MTLPQVPVEIPYRPYAICPPTNLMNPDGFFIVNMGIQSIEASIVNLSGAMLQNVRIYVEGISDPGIMLTPEIKHVGNILPSSSTSVRFSASFLNACVGTPLISFIIESDNYEFRRVIKKIFVTKIDYHKPTKKYSVITPQGIMHVRIHKAITGPKVLECKSKEPFIALLKDVTYEWIPNPSYEGVRGPFPYDDPWWKIALVILAVLLLLAALLYDYFSDGTLDGGRVSVSGTFDETDGTISCCTSVSTSAANEDDWLGRGLYAAAGGAATAAIASDGPDLHYRGQEKTPPKKGERTLSESVRLLIDYPVAPSPGVNYKISGKWRYVRTTDKNQYVFETTDKRENPHYLKSYHVSAPQIHDRKNDPLKICARFEKPDGKFYHGNDLYVSAVLVSTYGAVRRFQLKDDGIDCDSEANDGWYCGCYYFRKDNDKYRDIKEQDRPGDWYLFVFAQNVNAVLEGTDPYHAAHTIGGFVLTNQLELNFNQPCKLNHDAVIHVV